MRKNAFIAINHIKELNTFKAKQEVLNSLDFRNKLKSSGLPSNLLFWTIFKRYGLIKQISTDLFTWTSTKPIHYTLLQNIYSEYQKRAQKYSHTRYQKQKDIAAIQTAISFLKSKGYAVLVPRKKGKQSNTHCILLTEQNLYELL